MAITKDAFLIVPAVAFIGYVLLASTPQARMEHTCKPVGWAGNIATSITALISPSTAPKVQYGFDKLEYGCQYSLWRLLYQEEYNKAKEAENQQAQAAAQASETMSQPASEAVAPQATTPVASTSSNQPQAPRSR